MFASDGEMSPINHKVFKNQDASTVVRLDETERFEQTYPLSAKGRVNVSNVNGSITVEAWDRNEVKLEAVKTADTRESLADVEIKSTRAPTASASKPNTKILIGEITASGKITASSKSNFV
jgi:hypothetical protein